MSDNFKNIVELARNCRPSLNPTTTLHQPIIIGANRTDADEAARASRGGSPFPFRGKTVWLRTASRLRGTNGRVMYTQLFVDCLLAEMASKKGR